MHYNFHVTHLFPLWLLPLHGRNSELVLLSSTAPLPYFSIYRTILSGFLYLNFDILRITQTAQVGVASQSYYCFDSGDAVHQHKLVRSAH